jgi:cytochrome c553
MNTTIGNLGRLIPPTLSRRRVGVIILALTTLTSACRREMYDQPRGDPLKSSDFFANGAASRPLPPHTVPQENFHADLSYDTGKIGTNFLTQIPFPITRQVLERGREQFDIYCSVCHGRTGQGNGIVPQRGFPAPPSYDIPRLRDAQPGYFFNVMTRGYGVMFSYANRVNTDDRWSIAAYIRALQLSRNASLADVPPDERAKLEAKSP